MTPELLRAATGCTQDAADLYAEHLAAACAHYGIDASAQRLACFLGQLAHESGSLRHVLERADGQAYEGRRDLGNTEPGDGPRYKGRGLIQLTGRANYRAAAASLRAVNSPDFEAYPDAAADPRWAAWTAAEWWHRHGCNALADAGDVVGLGRFINRGNARSAKPANGEADRIQRTERACQALGIKQIKPDAPPAPSPEAAMPIAPIIAAVLPSIIEAVPKLGKLFGSGSEVAERNVKAAELVVETVRGATGALNAQDAAEKLAADPAAVQAATRAIDAIWYELTEAGGGGIDGARKADAAASARGDILHSPSFWVTLALLPLVYLVVGSVVGLWGTQWPPDVRAAIGTAVVSLIVGGAAGYYWGHTTSRNRTPSV